MITRLIYTKIWSDSFFSSLTAEEKLVFLYYLTNDLVNIIHFYECSDRKVCFETGVERGVLVKIKNKFEKNNKILFYKDYVLLVNASRYEKYTGKSNEIAKKKIISRLNNEVKKFFLKKKTGVYTPLYTPSINNKSEIINNKSEIINNKSNRKNIKKRGNADVNKILEYFQKKLNLPVLDDPIKKNRQYAWLLFNKFKKSLKEVYLVIDYASEDDWWRNNITSIRKLYYNSIKIIARRRGNDKTRAIDASNL